MQPSHQRAGHSEAKLTLTLTVPVSVRDNCPQWRRLVIIAWPLSWRPPGKRRDMSPEHSSRGCSALSCSYRAGSPILIRPRFRSSQRWWKWGVCERGFQPLLKPTKRNKGSSWHAEPPVLVVTGKCTGTHLRYKDTKGTYTRNADHTFSCFSGDSKMALGNGGARPK